MAGFDQGELITIPALPDMADWEAYETARQNLIPKLSLRTPARRYGVDRRNGQKETNPLGGQPFSE